jgi:hypothetical protein
VESSKWKTSVLKVAEFGQAVRWKGHRVRSQRTPQFRPAAPGLEVEGVLALLDPASGGIGPLLLIEVDVGR